LSLKSFVFTLKNPHNVPARRFALRDEKMGGAIQCCSDSGPVFGWNIGFLTDDDSDEYEYDDNDNDIDLRWNDISVSNNCNTHTCSFAWLGASYNNDTGLDGITFFTGSKTFQVKEIEVFEITD
jgi:hypothetical protein